jgi:hypothetical protein
MPDNAGGPRTDFSGLAQAMYRGGPINGRQSDPRTQEVIDSGIAKPADGRSLFGGSADQGKAAPGPGSQGQQPNAPPAAFVAEKYKAPEGVTVDPELMTDFGTAAKELKLDQTGGEKLLALHQRALAKQNEQLQHTWSSWEQTTRRDFGEQLPQVASEIKAAVGEGDDSKRFFELLQWSGLEWEPAFLRVLHRLATGGGRH